MQQGTLDKGIFVYVLKSCGLVKVVKKKYCQISRTQERIKPVKENLSRNTCSSYGRVSKLVKKLVKENLLVYTGLNTVMALSHFTGERHHGGQHTPWRIPTENKKTREHASGKHGLNKTCKQVATSLSSSCRHVWNELLTTLNL